MNDLDGEHTPPDGIVSDHQSAQHGVTRAPLATARSRKRAALAEQLPLLVGADGAREVGPERDAEVCKPDAPSLTTVAQTNPPSGTNENRVVFLPLDSIVGIPDVPKSALRRITRSIEARDVPDPITVCAQGDRFVLVRGRTHAAACRHLGIDPIPAVVWHGTTAQQTAMMRAALDTLHDRVRPIGRAVDVREIDTTGHPPSLDALADLMGLSRSAACGYRRIATALLDPECLRQAGLHWDADRDALDRLPYDELYRLAQVDDLKDRAAALANAVRSSCGDPARLERSTVESLAKAILTNGLTAPLQARVADLSLRDVQRLARAMGVVMEATRREKQ